MANNYNQVVTLRVTSELKNRISAEAVNLSKKVGINKIISESDVIRNILEENFYIKSKQSKHI